VAQARRRRWPKHTAAHVPAAHLLLASAAHLLAPRVGPAAGAWWLAGGGRSDTSSKPSNFARSAGPSSPLISCWVAALSLALLPLPLPPLLLPLPLPALVLPCPKLSVVCGRPWLLGLLAAAAEEGCAAKGEEALAAALASAAACCRSHWTSAGGGGPSRSTSSGTAPAGRAGEFMLISVVSPSHYR
jgi:hypothetical protein